MNTVHKLAEGLWLIRIPRCPQCGKPDRSTRLWGTYEDALRYAACNPICSKCEEVR